MALGQNPSSIRNQVLAEGARMTAISAAVGVFVAMLLTRSVSALLYGVKAADPITFATMAGVLMAAALAGCYVPARRATRVNPIIALKTE
jgi:ABC-type antimicrobial peptide transport system permease subunit